MPCNIPTPSLLSWLFSFPFLTIPPPARFGTLKILPSFLLASPPIRNGGPGQITALSLSQSIATNTDARKQSLLPSRSSCTDPPAGPSLESCHELDAFHMLDKIPHPNVTSWNLMLSRYNQAGWFDRSLDTFRKMRSQGFEPNQLTYGSVFLACNAFGNLGFGEQVYSLVLKNGFFPDGYVCSTMIDLFSKIGRVDEALKVFSESVSSNVVCWNAIISGAVRNDENLLALKIFCDMVSGFCMPNAYTFSGVLCACAADADMDNGTAIHAWVVKCDSGDDVFVGTAIVDLYAKCGEMGAAMKEFWLMPLHNVVSWTAAISGFAQKEEPVEAVILFKEMLQSGVKANKFTLTSILLACSALLMEQEACQIHCLAVKMGLYTGPAVKESFISTYAKVGSFHLSEKVFEEAGSVKSPGTWSAMVSGLSRQSSLNSVKLLKRMFLEGYRPDKRCLSVILASTNSLELGRQIHSSVIKDGLAYDVLVGSAVSTMYSRFGAIAESYRCFKQTQERDRVSWTSMISGFAGNGCSSEAFQLFREMILEEVVPDEVSLSGILCACNDSQFLIKGKEIHGHSLRLGYGNNTLISGALVSFYSRCENLPSARRIFDETVCKDEVTWSSIISGYATSGSPEEALLLFQQMLIGGFPPDNFTCSSVLGVCANLLRPILGSQVHGHTIKAGIIFHLSVGSALVTMYSKCGSIGDARRVFDEVDIPDLVMWTSMIDAYAQHGDGLEALKVFKLMVGGGVLPDKIALVIVLSACCHSGLVADGFDHFNSMQTLYGIMPESHHYSCMVDLLGRSGRLNEAVNFVENMPIKPDTFIWSTLLAACRVHGDVELASFVGKKLLELESCDSGSYAAMSNISADAGHWEDVARIRRSMKNSDARKEPGWSMI